MSRREDVLLKKLGKLCFSTAVCKNIAFCADSALHKSLPPRKPFTPRMSASCSLAERKETLTLKNRFSVFNFWTLHRGLQYSTSLLRVSMVRFQNRFPVCLPFDGTIVSLLIEL